MTENMNNKYPLTECQNLISGNIFSPSPLQVKNTTSKGPPQSPPHVSPEETPQERNSASPPYCSMVLEFSTHLSNVELEELPLLDILPPTTLCWQADCTFEIGPLCFSQDFQHLGGG